MPSPDPAGGTTSKGGDKLTGLAILAAIPEAGKKNTAHIALPGKPSSYRSSISLFQRQLNNAGQRKDDLPTQSEAIQVCKAFTPPLKEPATDASTGSMAPAEISAPESPPLIDSELNKTDAYTTGETGLLSALAVHPDSQIALAMPNEDGLPGNLQATGLILEESREGGLNCKQGKLDGIAMAEDVLFSQAAEAGPVVEEVPAEKSLIALMSSAETTGEAGERAKPLSKAEVLAASQNSPMADTPSVASIYEDGPGSESGEDAAVLRESFRPERTYQQDGGNKQNLSRDAASSEERGQAQEGAGPERSVHNRGNPPPPVFINRAAGIPEKSALDPAALEVLLANRQGNKAGESLSALESTASPGEDEGENKAAKAPPRMEAVPRPATAAFAREVESMTKQLPQPGEEGEKATPPEHLEEEQFKPEEGKEQGKVLSGLKTESIVAEDNSKPGSRPVQERMQFIPEKFMEQVVKKAELMIRQNSSEMRIQLHPEFLGRMTIKLVLEDGLLTARFIAENHQVKHLLESNLNSLRQSLETQGIRVEKTEVNVQLSNGGLFDGSEGSRQDLWEQPRFSSRYNYNGSGVDAYQASSAGDEAEAGLINSSETYGVAADGSMNFLI